MEAIEEIEKKLTNYENQYISENKLLIQKVNEYIEKEKLYKEEILSLYNQVSELKLISSNHNKKTEFDSKIIKEENLQLKDEYNIIKNEYNILKKELNKEKMKNEILVDKYNKLSYLYEQKEKENYKLIEKIDNKKEILELDKNEKNERDEILSYCNNTLSIFIKWIETNLISLYTNNININYDLYNNYINFENNDLFVFDKLRDSLLQPKNIIDNNYNKLNIDFEEEKQKIIDIQNQNEQYNNFIENIYNHLYQEIYNEKYFDINNNDIINNKYEVDNYFYFNEIENMISKTFELLKKIKESSYDKSLDKLIEDNTQLSKELEIIKSKTIALYNDNKILFKYKNELEKINEDLKKQLLNKDSNTNKSENKN